MTPLQQALIEKQRREERELLEPDSLRRSIEREARLKDKLFAMTVGFWMVMFWLAILLVIILVGVFRK